MKVLKGIKLKSLSDFDIMSIKQAIFEKLIVIIKPIDNPTPQDEVDFCKRIGPIHEITADRAKHIVGEVPGILRVTGELNDEGEPGLFGHTDALDWHCNQASNPNRMPIVYLRAIKGSKGSVTSWIDNALAYDALSPQWKETLQDKYITLGYKVGGYTPSNWFHEHHNEDDPFDLIHTNRAGRTGLYFPFLQTFGGNITNSTFKYLKEHCQYAGFRYDHHWEDGDIVMSEQFLTLHKRHEFKKMDARVLHRIALDAHPL